MIFLDHIQVNRVLRLLQDYTLSNFVHPNHQAISKLVHHMSYPNSRPAKPGTVENICLKNRSSLHKATVNPETCALSKETTIHKPLIFRAIAQLSVNISDAYCQSAQMA
jgi:hypothetical protein